GEQPQPSFIPILHYEPSDVVFVYTVRMQERYENLKVALEKLECHVYGIETDPYDIATIATALNEWLVAMPELSSQPMIFNLTGGTKTMSLAAYQVAAQYSAPVIYVQSERGQSIIDRYSWQDHQLCCQVREHVNRYLDLHDMLNL